MKAKFSFSKFFVTIILLITATCVNAQNIEFLTANGNNTADTSNTFIYTTGAKYMHWVNTGDVDPGVKAKPGTTAAQLAEQSKQGAAQAKKCLVNNIVHSNDQTKVFGPSIATQGQLDKAYKDLEGTLFPALVNFKGNAVSEMQLTHDTVTGVYGNKYSSTGHHASVYLMPCMISRQNGKDFIFADARCGQPFASKTTMMMLQTGQAEIVATTTVTPPTPATPAANNGNVNTGGGNGNVSIPIPTGGTINLTVIAGNGNGNPVVTATGGTATGGSATATSGTPAGNAAGNNIGSGGFNFGTFVPGAGSVTTTSTPPGGGSATTSSSSTNVATGPDYSKQLAGISRGTQATGAGSIMQGMADFSREIRQWGSVFGAWGNTGTTIGGAGGGLVTNPG